VAKPAPKPAPADPAVEKPVYDLWHFQDDFIQPMQKSRAAQERNRTYRTAYHIATKKVVPLADPTLAEVQMSETGEYGFGQDDRAYRREVEFDKRYADLYLVDAATGDRKKVASKQAGLIQWSHEGNYAVHFDGKDWTSIAAPSGAVTNLTAKLNVRFFDEDDDHPDTPRSYGFGGWLRDGKSVLLYDRYDVWQVAADGSSAVNLTDGMGRAEGIVFRVVRLADDPRERGVDPAKPLLLRAESLETRESGFYRDRIGGTQRPERIVWGARNYGNPVKARNADVLLFTASRFDEYPELQLTDLSFKAPRKLTNLGNQMSAYAWGTSELMQFRSIDGQALKATLVKPANFDPKKKYPMIVYIYERLSQNVHSFVAPSPSQNVNASHYASNGYLILYPDIAYRIGYPGESALKCVLPAIDAVVAQGFVDDRAIGIQGHSWGGYQIAYMVTQTNRFKAAAAGAPVSNMFSAYNGIRWGPGLPRQFQYERTQSRIGGTPWQYPLRFLENSPIFHADKIQTPLLLLHNDQDDAVPWYQGIELFLGLRRLGKEAYMFTYNGEPHGIRKRVNQKDYARRTQEFFDFELKGAKKPEWMERGRPYLEKEDPAGAAAASSDQR
jgi:dipeptidyl aminopeptidase/acylaminoacyl peptidase